jgi:hypothetical protein
LPSLSNTLCFGVKLLSAYKAKGQSATRLSISKANQLVWSFIPLAITKFTDQSKVVNAKELLLYDSSFFTYVFKFNHKDCLFWHIAIA